MAPSEVSVALVTKLVANAESLSQKVNRRSRTTVLGPGFGRLTLRFSGPVPKIYYFKNASTRAYRHPHLPIVDRSASLCPALSIGQQKLCAAAFSANSNLPAFVPITLEIVFEPIVDELPTAVTSSFRDDMTQRRPSQRSAGTTQNELSDDALNQRPSISISRV
jgi:hypothetical protein